MICLVKSKLCLFFLAGQCITWDMCCLINCISVFQSYWEDNHGRLCRCHSSGENNISCSRKADCHGSLRSYAYGLLWALDSFCSAWLSKSASKSKGNMSVKCLGTLTYVRLFFMFTVFHLLFHVTLFLSSCTGLNLTFRCNPLDHDVF